MNDIHQSFSKLRILVVDDHMLMRGVITQNLRNLGYTDIDTATNGQEALKALNAKRQINSPYHIAFLDWHMPIEDGMSVLQTCRKDNGFNDMAIVMLTAEQEKKSVLQAIEKGATSYIVKPVSQDALEKNMQNIIRWLEKKGVQGSVSTAPAAAAHNTDMRTLSDEMKQELRPVIAKGIEKIFSNIFNVQIIPEDYAHAELDNSMICMGRLHQKDISINLRFFFDQQLLKPLLMQIYSPQFLADDAIYGDAACEIVNILASQVKAFLNGHGYKLTLDQPEMCAKPIIGQSEPVIDVRFSLNKDRFFLVDVTTS